MFQRYIGSGLHRRNEKQAKGWVEGGLELPYRRYLGVGVDMFMDISGFWDMMTDDDNIECW